MTEVTKYGYLATQEFPFRRERVNDNILDNEDEYDMELLRINQTINQDFK